MTRKRQLILGGAALAVLLHLVIVISVAKQPLHVNAFPDQRSLIWKFHHDTIHRAGPGSDFFAVYHAAIKQSRGESPYDNKEVPKVTPEFYPFRYLPIVAQTLGRMATWFSGRTAYVIWVVLLELLLAGTLFVLWKIVPSARVGYGLSALLLFSSPYFLELHIGQFTFATCALLAIGLALLDRTDKNYSIGGTAAYAGAVLLKVFPLAAGAALIRRKKGFIAAAVAGALVAITAVPYFLSYRDEWTTFAKVNFGDTGTEGFHGGNYGFLYMVFLAMKGIGGNGAVRGFLVFARNWQLIVLGISAAMVLWRKPTILTGGLTLACAHMISYKHVWEHHASGALVLGVFLFIRLYEDRGWWGRWVALGCIIMLALPTPFRLIDSLDPGIYDPTPQWSPFWRLVLPACKGLPVFILWALGLTLSFREGRKPTAIAAAATNKPATGEMGSDPISADKPATSDKPATDKPATDKPSANKPATDKPATDKPATDEPAADKPSAYKPATDKPATDKPATDTTDKPATAKPTADKPATDKPATDEPAADKPSAYKPATDKPATDKPATDTTDKPATAKPTADKPATDKPATDEPAADTTDNPAPDTADKPATDKPATDKADKPATGDTDKGDTDKGDTDKADTDKADTDKADTDKAGAGGDKPDAN